MGWVITFVSYDLEMLAPNVATIFVFNCLQSKSPDIHIKDIRNWNLKEDILSCRNNLTPEIRCAPTLILF